MAQLDNLKLVLGVSDTLQDANLTYELELAAEFIANRRDSYDEDTDEPVIERAYRGSQVTLASESYSKRGAEGEGSHSEAGISRRYENGSLYSTATVNQIIPKVRVIEVEDTDT